MTKKTKIVIIVAVAVVLIGSLFTWYLLGNKNSSSPSAPSAVILSACTRAGGDETLCDFYAGMQDFTKMSSQITATSNGETMKMRYDGRGNSHIESADGMQITVFGESTYLLEKGATEWLKMPESDTATQPESIDMSALEERFKSEDGKEVEQLVYDVLGKKKIRGQDVVGYKIYKDTSKSGGTEFWFSKKDNRIYQMNYVGEDGEGVTTIDITYDEIEITKPSPVREMGLS